MFYNSIGEGEIFCRTDGYSLEIAAMFSENIFNSKEKFPAENSVLNIESRSIKANCELKYLY